MYAMFCDITDKPTYNLALKKPSRLSTMFSSTTVASKANDGNTDGDFVYCATTAEREFSDNWWTVDLGASYRVMAIQVWNRERHGMSEILCRLS
jgi:uncharacterized protein YtpQ (UPF0354 family)